jgi:hypothetical protein
MSFITKKKRIETLQKALGGFVDGDEIFSCNAVWGWSPTRIADEMEAWYGRVLARHSGLDEDDPSGLVVAFNPDHMDHSMPEFQEHRMMWLAWLITMMEDGLEP